MNVNHLGQIATRQKHLRSLKAGKVCCRPQKERGLVPSAAEEIPASDLPPSSDIAEAKDPPLYTTRSGRLVKKTNHTGPVTSCSGARDSFRSMTMSDTD